MIAIAATIFHLAGCWTSAVARYAGQALASPSRLFGHYTGQDCLGMGMPLMQTDRRIETDRVLFTGLAEK